MQYNILLISQDSNLIQDLEHHFDSYHFHHCINFNEALDHVDDAISLAVIDTALFTESAQPSFEQFRSVSLHKDIPFVYLTDEDHFLAHRINANCIDVISKPVSLEHILNRVGLVLTDQREKIIFQGYLDDISFEEVVKICEQIFFTGIILIHYNYEHAKIVFENGRLERAILDYDTDWAVIDYIITWRSGEFQIYGNADAFSENLFLQRKSKRDKAIVKDPTALEAVLKRMKLEMIELLGIAIIDSNGHVLAEHIRVELINMADHGPALKPVLKNGRLMLLSMNSTQLDELIFIGDKHQIYMKQIGRRKLYFTAYFKKSANVGIVKYILQKYENEVLTFIE